MARLLVNRQPRDLRRDILQLRLWNFSLLHRTYYLSQPALSWVRRVADENKQIIADLESLANRTETTDDNALVGPT
jgi:hypothetical protein